MSFKYAVCFRSWATDEEGVEALVRTVYAPSRRKALEAARRHDVVGFSSVLYDSGYYEGFGSSREARINTHAQRLGTLIDEIESAIGIPKPSELPKQRELAGGIHPGVILIALAGIGFLAMRKG